MPSSAASAPSCATLQQFMAKAQAVTAACCTESSPCPSGGIPTVCTEECAAILLPMQVRIYLSAPMLCSPALPCQRIAVSRWLCAGRATAKR